MEREPLGSIRWPVPGLVGLVLLIFVFTVVGAFVAFGGLLDPLPEDLRVLAQTAILGLQYALPIGLVWLLALVRGVSLRDAVLMRRVNVAQGIGLGIGVAITVRFFNGLYSIIITLLGVDPSGVADVTELFPETFAGTLSVILLAVVFAPIAEEIMFRGVLYPGLRDRYNPIAASIVSALVFAIFHGDPIVFVPIFVLGLALAWITEMTRSVWPAIIGHAVFNGTAVVLLYVLKFLPEIPTA